MDKTTRQELDEWLDVTGAIAKGTSWEYEVQSIADDADREIARLRQRVEWLEQITDRG